MNRDSVDYQYLDVVSDIINTGTWQRDRTSVGKSLQTFGKQILFDTKDKYAPFIQCRKYGPRLSFWEWQWMMRGLTDSQWLEDRNVYFWSDNTTREFLDGRGLYHLPEKELGPAYGKQFRDFGGVDQVQKVFDQIKNNPTSRRHIVSIWNVPELDDAALEPCAFLYEFMVEGDTLHLHQHMRSADVVFGVPYNMGFSYFWLKSFADALGYKTGKYWLTMNNAHIYENQYKIAVTMLTGYNDEGLALPSAEITTDVSTLDDILDLDWSDIDVQDWVRGPTIGNAEMAK